MTRIRNFLVLLRAQLWIIPALCSAAALALAYFMLTYGAGLFDSKAAKLWWLYSGDAGSARDLLSSLLSGLMTMTSLVVSVTFVILTLAANQLGPRLIGTFMADRQIQSVLGLFLGTILYIIVVLRSLNESLGPRGVSHIAVTGASVLTVICLFALLFYVHKIARSIIADTVVDRVARELRRNIGDILPQKDEEPAATAPIPTWEQTGAIALGQSGYIQTVDYPALVKLASERDVVLRVAVRAGHFVFEAGEHVAVHSVRPLKEDAAEAIRNAFVIGTERSPAQDLEFAVRQLVEVALRALSPGIHDPFTAIAVIDRLGAALEDILSRRLQPHILLDSDGAVRVIADSSELGGLMDASFDQIRQAAQGVPAVLIRMADVLGGLAAAIQNDGAKRETLRHLQKLTETVLNATMAVSDRDVALARIHLSRAKVEGIKACGNGAQSRSP